MCQTLSQRYEPEHFGEQETVSAFMELTFWQEGDTDNKHISNFANTVYVLTECIERNTLGFQPS